MLEPSCSVSCGERNFEALKPLAKRLLLSDETVGQVAVPLVEKETLDFIKIVDSFYVCVFVDILGVFVVLFGFLFQRNRLCGSFFLSAPF